MGTPTGVQSSRSLLSRAEVRCPLLAGSARSAARAWRSRCPRHGLGFTGAGGVEGEPVPAALVARTEQLTVIPLVRPVTTSGDPVPVFDLVPHLAV